MIITNIPASVLAIGNMLQHVSYDIAEINNDGAITVRKASVAISAAVAGPSTNPETAISTGSPIYVVMKIDTETVLAGRFMTLDAARDRADELIAAQEERNEQYHV